jgi:hypothetical protein
MQSIAHHTLFLKAFEKDGKEPEKLDELYHRPYLTARFTMARM